MLTDAQRSIVFGDVRNRAVYAGPGSGKTAALTQHLIHLISSGRIAPSRTIVMTFTRQAAHELRHRLVASTQVTTSQVASLRIGTFHSVIFRMLLQLNVPVYPLLTAEEQRRILAGVIHGDGRRNIRSPEALTSRLSKHHATWPGTPLENKLQRLVAAYERRKRQVHRWDFDDVLSTFCHVATNPANNWSQVPRIDYILVDEFQDTNGIQIHILRFLHNQFGAPLFVVGDEDQSIYGFRGADPVWLLEFPTLFENVSTHTLAANFRSDASIVRASHNVIRCNVHRSDKIPEIISLNAGVTRAYGWSDEHDEASVIANRLCTRTPQPAYSVAILARTRFQLMAAARVIRRRYTGMVEYRTFHDAKGKEWDEVHLIGAVDHNPYLQRDDKGVDVEEERRLFYVAMTRSRHSLYIHAPRRCRGKKMPASRFIQEAEISEQEGITGQPRKAGDLI